LTRLYIGKFRCFVNFEFKPARRNRILGRNGSGKSSLLDALLGVRQFVITGGLAVSANRRSPLTLTDRPF